MREVRGVRGMRGVRGGLEGERITVTTGTTRSLGVSSRGVGVVVVYRVQGQSCGGGG